MTGITQEVKGFMLQRLIQKHGFDDSHTEEVKGSMFLYFPKDEPYATHGLMTGIPQEGERLHVAFFTKR
jgi:hypothetical protein